MNRFFQVLFRKNELYAIIWAYIVSLHENLENIRLDIPIIIIKFGIPRTTLLRIIQFGCNKLDIRYSLKNGVIQFHYDMKKGDDPKQTRLDLGEADIPVIPATDASETIASQKKIILREMSVAEFAKEVIKYLNEKTGRRYRYCQSSVLTCINARRNEGYTLQDFFKVIDNKSQQWLNDPRMDLYLRPQTLFNGKFDGYLQEKDESQILKMHTAISNAQQPYQKSETRMDKLSDVMNHFNEKIEEDD
jgi:uncharacterized phage protein (TIGR02220 family)